MAKKTINQASPTGRKRKKTDVKDLGVYVNLLTDFGFNGSALRQAQ